MRAYLPKGLAVMSELYRDHVIFATTIVVAIFASGFLLHP